MTGIAKVMESNGWENESSDECQKTRRGGLPSNRKQTAENCTKKKITEERGNWYYTSQPLVVYRRI